MNIDLLDKFRWVNQSPDTFRQIAKSATPDQPQGDEYFYHAFGHGQGTSERLEIRRVLGETHAPSYRYLMDVSFNADQGTELVLMYSFLLVKVQGRNMQNLIRSVLDSSCLFIQDFHPNEFTPSAPDAPFIASIEIVKHMGITGR